MHTSKLMRRLQKALIQNKDIININTTEFYSDDKGRTITKYIVTSRVIKMDEDGNEIRRNEKVIETCSQIEVVRELAERLKKIQGGE